MYIIFFYIIFSSQQQVSGIQNKWINEWRNKWINIKCLLWIKKKLCSKEWTLKIRTLTKEIYWFGYQVFKVFKGSLQNLITVVGFIMIFIFYTMRPADLATSQNLRQCWCFIITFLSCQEGVTQMQESIRSDILLFQCRGRRKEKAHSRAQRRSARTETRVPKTNRKIKESLKAPHYSSLYSKHTAWTWRFRWTGSKLREREHKSSTCNVNQTTKQTKYKEGERTRSSGFGWLK